ncbi:hypothetical protein BFF78_11985 [Streptomyces fodineus]|uniref:HTH iclR-type domain-containing protein n=1 Tax=Streptomyces fodineus TaxID=1904616 RepID=A0A1D7Y7S1_9ACTN|nr:hypothetical protein BFF78_11985 [Streptomyces fodineus]
MFSQVLLMQVAIAAGVTVLATGLFLAPLSKQLDQEAMRRALAIAETTAQDPQIAEGVLTTPPTSDGPVQKEAERIRKATHAEYIVVLDRHWLRWSSGHSEPTTDLICGVLHRADQPLSAHEVAARTGLSRSTAQRYLRHLEQAGRLRLYLKYGDTGRPEHRYAWVAP